MIGSQFACAAVKKGWVANCQGSSPLVDMYVYAADLRFSAVQALPTAYVPPPDLTRARRRRRQRLHGFTIAFNGADPAWTACLTQTERGTLDPRTD